MHRLNKARPYHHIPAHCFFPVQHGKLIFRTFPSYKGSKLYTRLLTFSILFWHLIALFHGIWEYTWKPL
jgi:hypothetical protein